MPGHLRPAYRHRNSRSARHRKRLQPLEDHGRSELSAQGPLTKVRRGISHPPGQNHRDTRRQVPHRLGQRTPHKKRHEAPGIQADRRWAIA